VRHVRGGNSVDAHRSVSCRGPADPAEAGDVGTPDGDAGRHQDSVDECDIEFDMRGMKTDSLVEPGNEPGVSSECPDLDQSREMVTVDSAQAHVAGSVRTLASGSGGLPHNSAPRVYPDPAPRGSWLLGSPSEPIRRPPVRVQVLLTKLPALANLIAAGIVGALLTVVIPGPNAGSWRFAIANCVVLIALVVGLGWGTRIAVRGLQWSLDEEQVPERREQQEAHALPWRLAAICGVLWVGGALVYTIALGILDSWTVPKVFTVGCAGATVYAFCYVLSEFALRHAAARALAQGRPRRVRIAGVTGRALLAWAVGTGLPVVGLMLVALFSLTHPVTSTQLAVSILTLGGITVVVGLLLTLLGANATVDPLRSVVAAMAKIERGEPDAEVVVDDGTEFGELQAGFNRMAAGLREREWIRELFGLHVGHKVAEAALLRNPVLGGEERSVAVLFIDLIGSTTLAAARPPGEVVDLLNSFFDVVVQEVERHEGIVNKFEGDGALAIFGAPGDLADPAGHALAAARAIRRRLPDEVPECDAAIGIAFGVAVAGNIGAQRRFEYSVIGDPVNEAARLCELAKSVPGRVLASDRAIDAASVADAHRWRLGDAVTLRGRPEPTRLATPNQ